MWWDELVSILAVIVAIITVYLEIRYQRKQLQTDGLSRTFEILRDDEHRKLRDWIRGRRKNLPEGEDPNDARRKITRDFNMVGAMMENNLVSKNAFYGLYYKTVEETWNALSGFIKNQRENEKIPDYAEFFEKLANSANEYDKNKNFSSSLPFEITRI